MKVTLVTFVMLVVLATACGGDKPPMVPDPDTTTVMPSDGGAG